MPFMIDGLWRYKLGIFFYTMTNFFVLLGVKKFLEIENSRITYSAIAALIITEAAVLSAPDSRFLVFYTGYVFLALVNIFIVSAAAMFIYAIKKDPRRYWYFIFLVVPVVISVARNSWYILNFRFSEMPLLIFLHVPLVFMFITLYYIYDFEKSRKEKEQLYTALLRKSKNDARTLQTLKDKNRKPEPRDLISNVIDYLDQNYSEKYDRIELSKKFGLNEDYMGQIFKKAAGTNISSYINTNRINAAKELLTDTSAKIIDIAYHVGFDNLTHFHRQFKKQTGCTPNEYRTIISREG
jgi:AraC-like DNA-binding protein